MIWPNEYSGIRYDKHSVNGLHCWSLIVDVYRKQLGVILCPYGDAWAKELIVVAKAMREEFREHGNWVDVVPGAQKEFDIVLMSGLEKLTNGKSRTANIHVGVMYRASHVLHIEEESEASCVPLRDLSVRHRITGFKRHFTQCL